MKMKNKKILIRGTWLESYNVGDNAIIEGLKSSLKGRGELKAITGSVERVKKWLGIDAVKVVSSRNPFLFLKIFAEVKNSKAFLLTGGTPIYNDATQMCINFIISSICKFYRVPVFVFGVSYRECQSRIVRWLVIGIFRNCEKIYFREYGSIAEVKHNYGNVVRGKIDFLPDPATQIDYDILVPQVSVDASSNISLPEAPYVVVCPRDFSADKSFSNHHYNQEFDSDRYLKLLALCIKQLLENTNYNIVFLPMNVQSPDDDTVISSYLYDLYKENFKHRMTVIKAQLHPASVIKIFRDASFSITVRFHAGVLSCSNGTPMISLAYDKKNIDISEVLEMKDFTFDIKNTSEIDLVDAISTMEDNISKLSKKCVENNMKLRKIFRTIIQHHFSVGEK